ncbi:hypothetical protein C2S51_006154 [Perilla frutescens var. frutescens]|nr:hypothetical protein C2S51_006154 [Perilla frutescens var. frutescens]
MMMKGVAVMVAVVVVVASLAPTPGEAVSCGDVQTSLSPCLAYLVGGGEPTGTCCGGVRNLAGSLQSQQDRQTACSCMKSAASSYNIQPDSAVNLPGKCGVSLGIDVSPTVDCTQVS